MSARPPDMSTKLPDYSLPSVVPIRPPSPLSEEPGNLANTLITPVGCELILRNPAPLKDSSTLKLVKDVIAKISKENTHLHALPVDVLGTGNSSKDANSCLCYIQLFPRISTLDLSPRPDLLWQWKEPLLEALPNWDMMWAPQKRWKDKKTLLCFTSKHPIATTDQEAFVIAVERTCKSGGYKTTGSFFMKPLSAGVVLSTIN